MPVCATCCHQWSFKETMRAMYTLKPSMTCPNCRQEQHLTSVSRKRGAYMPFLILIPMLLNAFFDLNWLTLFGGMALIAAVFHLIYPQLIELTDKEEPIW
ncbi:cxxc_20_cxxc protein [Bhargavaea ginsengi]|uniref:Cxxc_20_cxxc protein n=1 Tax=Bhargavaea ginsengi TaxID=426757 RepID=A0A1H6XVA0_9BACL|nr:TIGR04104 family putative zinc finger protein [Bhargavaea ginsengi]SEJ28822.1 cxxc_20_cxxc protein [Bhargavaea ginsengi]